MDKIDLSQIWPEWQIEGAPLGSGSFGSVYKAVRRDNMVESYAAVKVISIPKTPSEIDSLRSEGLDTERATTYLQGIVNDCVSEIQLMESLKGIQNIVSVEDYKVVKKVDEIGWDIYIRMELLTPLTTYITEHQLTEKEVIKLGCDICTALEVCSKKGIIHRDIKPENIFVNEFGDFKLGDFGIARKLEGQISNLSRKGTPNYMAPEVANSKDYDARVDTYSLGIVLYRFLNNNRLPFLNTEEQITNPVERENASTRRLRGEKLPPPSNASAQMADVVLRACAYNPNARFQDATQMKQALQDVQVGAPPKPKRRKGPIFAVITVLVLLGGLAALYVSGILTDLFGIPNILPNAGNSGKPGEVNESDELEAEQIAAVIADADALIQAQDYEGAIAVIQVGLKDHSDSEELLSKQEDCEAMLQEQLKAAALAAAQALADSKDYAGAIALLQEAISQQGEQPELLDACAVYQEAYNNTVRTQALADANRLAADEDYLGAISIIDEIISALGEEESLVSRRAELEVFYINQVVGQADDLLLVEEFDAAESVINKAIKQFPNNEVLHSEAQRIQYARPVYLLDEVAPYKKSPHYSDRSIVTLDGTNYLHGFTCMGYGEEKKGNQMFFNLDGKYSMISFTAGIVADRGKKVTFYFHADGELVYKCSVKGGDRPSSHDINIVGCKQFKVSVYDGTKTIDKSGTYALTNIMVKRNASSFDDNKFQLQENQVYLLDEIKPYKTSSHYEEAAVLSMGGQNFGHGFSCMGYGDKKVGNSVYFNLDGRYSKITFAAGLVLDRELKVTYRFYTDGKLAYELKMGPSDLAKVHSFSVEGCKQLLICVTDGKKTSDVSGTYGIAEIIMDKSSTYNDSSSGSESLRDGEEYLLKVVKPHKTPARYDDSNVLTMGGKRYVNGFSCMGNGAKNKGNQTYFQLDGQYREISFTAGTILDRDLSVTFRFFADGKKVYEFTMKKGDLPTEHRFSVEGCSELVVSVYDGQKGADTSGTYGLANIIVSKG